MRRPDINAEINRDVVREPGLDHLPAGPENPTEVVQDHLRTTFQTTSKAGLSPVNIGARPLYHYIEKSIGSASSEPTSGDARLHIPVDVVQVVRAFIRRFVVLQSADIELLIALWVIHTYAIDCASYTPYLHITGPTPECGKSRLLEVLEVLVHNPWLTGGSSKSSLMRTLQATHPTLLLDEADTALSQDDDSLTNILNNGFQRGKAVSVSDKDAAGNWTPTRFDVFGPKAISGIDDIRDTIATRCIRIPMEPRQKNQTVDRFRPLKIAGEATAIRQSISDALTGDVRNYLASVEPDMPEELKDRQQDVLEPLMAIADAAGIGSEARSAAVTVMLAAKAERDDPKLDLLQDIQEYLSERPELTSFVTTEGLVGYLNAQKHRRWPTISPIGLTDHRLGKMLRSFKVDTNGRTTINGKKYRGYQRKQLEQVIAKYLQ
jgi:hypothetical protein